MLTNTLGIVIFILIFTVLTASGVVLPKRLPMEKVTDATSVDFFCAGDRVVQIPDALATEFLEPFEHQIRDLSGFIRRFESRRLDKEDFIVTGEAAGYGSTLSAAVVITPKVGSGETVDELAAENSRYRNAIAGLDAQKQFVHLIVRPDSIAAFTAARDIAARAGLSTGWWPLDYGASMRTSVSGGGRAPRVQ